MDRRAALRLLGAGALGWLTTRTLGACSDEAAGPAETTFVALDEATVPGEGARRAEPQPTYGGPTDAGTDGDAGDEVLDASGDASSAADASDAAPTQYVTLYDTYAVALYFDGSLGPTTGVIKAADVAAGLAKDYDFWHGHSGMLHRYALTPADFANLKKKLKIETMTTIVEGHQHKLFVDPTDPKWRVPGAQPIKVPV